MRWNDQPRLVLELYLLKLAQPFVPLSELVERLEKIEKNIPFDEPKDHSYPAKQNVEQSLNNVRQEHAVQNGPGAGQKTAGAGYTDRSLRLVISSNIERTYPFCGL